MPNPQQTSNRSLGVVILAGGQSQRMGYPKWKLPFGDESLLQRTVRICRQISSEIVIAGVDGQTYPDLENLPAIIRDKNHNCGPLEGIRGGLEYLERQGLHWGFVTACDVPELVPQVAENLLQHSDGFEAVIPYQAERVYGMTAIYQCKLHKRIDELIKNPQLRVSELSKEFHANRIPVDTLRSVDQELTSLANVNYPDQYLQVLEKLGFTAPAGFDDPLKN